MVEDSTSTTRFEWIDVSKGIGIILVVLVHSIIPLINSITTHLSSFAIPLFFVLAGLTYDSERHQYRLKRLAKVRGQQFLVPYFCLYTIIMILFYLVPNAVETYLTPDQLVFWFFYGSGPPNQSTHLWFLPVLYFGFVLFIIIDRLLVNLPRYTRLILVPSLAVIATGINSSFAPMLVPWHLGSIIIAAIFMLIGNEIRNQYGMMSWSTKFKVLDVVLIVALSSLLILLSELNGFTDIAVDNLGNSVWLYLINGTIGTSVVFIAASLLADQSVFTRTRLSQLGNMSQEVYEFHPLTFLLMTPILLLTGWALVDIQTNFNNLWILRFSLGMIVSILVVVFVIRKNRFLSVIFTGFQQRRH
ncbi:MAG: acyltransferase family protein [Promethearchaeota archaeon]